MKTVDRALLTARSTVLKSKIATVIASRLVSLYRWVLYRFGDDTAILEFDDGQAAVFQSETIEEIRHFYPVPGEKVNIEDFLSELNEDDVVYDIGGHIGMYSIPAAQRVDNGQVFSFEPLPANANRLRENAERNDVDVEVFEIALSEETRVSELSVDLDEPGAIAHSNPSLLESSIEMEFVRGEEFVSQENLPHPTVLKIDVEGAELPALRGMNSILNDCRLIYAELSEHSTERYGTTPEDFVDFLEERGFKVESLGDGGISHDDIKAIRY